MIDILIPVLGRPQNAAKVASSIRENTKVPHEVVFIASWHDEAQIEACEATGARVVISSEDPYAYKINLGCEETSDELIFTGADDLRFHAGWFEAALAVHEDMGRRVIGTNDLGNPTVMRGRHATHSLVHRSYLELGTIDEPGLLLHEGYRHNFVDTEFVETAMKRGEWAFAAASHVEHLHPFWHKGQDDLIYEMGRRANLADMRLWRKRRRLWR